MSIYIDIHWSCIDPVLRFKNINEKQKWGIEMEHWLKMGAGRKNERNSSGAGSL